MFGQDLEKDGLINCVGCAIADNNGMATVNNHIDSHDTHTHHHEHDETHYNLDYTTLLITMVVLGIPALVLCVLLYKRNVQQRLEREERLKEQKRLEEKERLEKEQEQQRLDRERFEARPEYKRTELIKQLADKFNGGFDERLKAIYIPPQGARTEHAQPNEQDEFEFADLLSAVRGQFVPAKGEPLRSLLLLGQSGMGKTSLSLRLCEKMWQGIDCQPEVIVLEEGHRIPLYIYLPQYRANLESESTNLLEEILRARHFGLSDEACELLLQQPLLLILDGLDEVNVNDNLYKKLGCDEMVKSDICMLVTCRPEALLGKYVSYSFEVSPASGNYADAYQSSSYGKLYLQPFTDNQILGYFRAYCKQKCKDASKGENYFDALKKIPSLRKLVTTPFLLMMVAEVLSDMEEGISEKAIQDIHFTQSTLFDCFLNGVPVPGNKAGSKEIRKGGWFLREVKREGAQRLKNEHKLPESVVIDCMVLYAENLADSLLDVNSGQLNIEPIPELQTLQSSFTEGMKEEHKRLLFDDNKNGEEKPNAYFRAIRSSCLLWVYGKENGHGKLENGEFTFIHKSIAEYLVAQKLGRELRDNQNDLVNWLGDEDENESGKQKHGLNRVLLTKEPEIIARLAEMANESNEPIDFNNWELKRAEDGEQLSLKQLLFNILMASKGKPELRIAAANAITVLNHSRVDFSGKDLRKVQIPGADLTAGHFWGTDFRGANLSHGTLLYNDERGKNKLNKQRIPVRFHQAFLLQARFEKADMKDINFGEFMYLKCSHMVDSVNWYMSNGVLRWLVRDYNGRVHYLDTDRYERPILNTDRKLFCDNEISTIAVNSAAGRLALGKKDGSILLRDVENVKVEHTLSKHSGSIVSLAFSPDGKTVASGGDCALILWNAENAKVKHTLSSKHSCSVKSLAFSPDGKTVASGGDCKYVKLWDVDSGKVKYTLSKHSGSVKSLAFSPDGKTAASGGEDCAVILWDVDSGEVKYTLSKHSGSVASLAFSPDGKILAFGGGYFISLRNTVTGQDIGSLFGHGNPVTTLAFSPNGKTLVSGDCNWKLRTWDLESDARVVDTSSLNRHDFLTNVAISPDGKTFALGSHYPNCQVTLYDIESGQSIYSLPSFKTDNNISWGISFSPDGTLLALARGSRSSFLCCDFSDAIVELWDIENRRYRSRLSTKKNKTDDKKRERDRDAYTVPSLSFSYDGKTLALGGCGDDTVRFWDVDSGKLKDKLLVHARCDVSVSFSPDGRTFASAARISSVKFWDICKDVIKQKHDGDSPMEHVTGQNSIAFSHDSKTFASGGNCKHVILWDIDSGKVKTRLKPPHKNFIRSIAFSVDGKILISGDWSNTVKIWDVDNCAHLQSLSLGVWIDSIAVSKDRLLIAGKNGHLFLMHFGSRLSSGEGWQPPCPLWIKRDISLLNLHSARVSGALNLSKHNRALLEQHGAVVIDVPSNPSVSSSSPPESMVSNNRFTLLPSSSNTTEKKPDAHQVSPTSNSPGGESNSAMCVII